MTKNNEEMTDKQIIIDGVDVKKCKYFYRRTKDCVNESTIDEPCAEFPNCHYKQFKRKEQECEKAKQNAQDTYELYQALMESFNILQSEKIKLEQECEQQKAELELFKTSNQTTIDQLKAENEDLKKSVLQECPNCGKEYLNYKGAALYFENSDLKQTLTKIKEIAENSKKDICNNCGWRNTDSCDPTDYTCGEFLKIIEIINEVEDVNNNR